MKKDQPPEVIESCSTCVPGDVIDNIEAIEPTEDVYRRAPTIHESEIRHMYGNVPVFGNVLFALSRHRY